MGFFSKTCEYGLRAVFYIAYHADHQKKVGIKEVAKEVDSPEHFLAKILQELSRKGIIQSAKGPHGGFYLNDESLQRPIADIVEALDGGQIFTGCALGLDHCSAKNPCPLHHQIVEIRGQLHQIMRSTKIEEFNTALQTGLFTLKNAPDRSK